MDHDCLKLRNDRLMVDLSTTRHSNSMLHQDLHVLHREYADNRQNMNEAVSEAYRNAVAADRKDNQLLRDRYVFSVTEYD